MPNLNPQFLNRMQNILGEDFPLFLSALEEEQKKGLFVNVSKLSVDKFAKLCDFSISKIDYDPFGFFVENLKLGHHPLHHAGAFYMQEPSAMFTINALNLRGDERVVDLCASPGGKTIQLALRVPNGLVVSNEIVKQRADILFSNVERMGLKNVIVANETPKNIADAYGGVFDVCLVDAPCSGEGMFRRGEHVVNEWNENLPIMCAKRQSEILTEADKLTKVGGFIIYSTCTYSLEENEGVVGEFLKSYNYKLINISSKFDCGVNMPQAVRLYPHKNKGEGQFVALLQKLGGNEYFGNKPLKLKENKLAEDFIKENTNLNINAFEFKNFCYYVLNTDFVKMGVNYVCPGVRLGEVKNNRFEPEHFLFSAFGGEFKRTINFSFKDETIKKYLRGESFECSLSNGYASVQVDGCPLGGIKVTNGQAKNHYPKGLRNFK